MNSLPLPAPSVSLVRQAVYLSGKLCTLVKRPVASESANSEHYATFIMLESVLLLGSRRVSYRVSYNAFQIKAIPKVTAPSLFVVSFGSSCRDEQK